MRTFTADDFAEAAESISTAGERAGAAGSERDVRALRNDVPIHLDAGAVTADIGTLFENTRTDREYEAKPDLGVPPYDRRSQSGCFAVVWLLSDGVIFSARCRDFGHALRMTRQHKRAPTWVVSGLERELDVAQLCLGYRAADWLDAPHMDAAVRKLLDVVATQNLPSASRFIQPKKARSPSDQ